MRYFCQQNRIKITAAELVKLAQDATPNARVPDEELLYGTNTASGVVKESFFCAWQGLRYEVNARAEKMDKDGVVLRVTLPSGISSPPPEAIRQARGEAFVCAHIIAQKTAADIVPIRVVYCSDNSTKEFAETPGEASLTAFFNKLLDALTVYHAPELDRVCRRLPTFTEAKYPFSRLRLGQGELISSVYGALKRKQRLFACAPTGIGKTMSVLFPAIRALGEGVFDKIFYFTSKSTGSETAVEAAKKLFDVGADLRAVVVSAREKLCPCDLLCRKEPPAPCPFPTFAADREKEAAAELLSMRKAVVGTAELTESAKAHRVCPYELALHYAQLCDLVICDYNYLFDLRVYFKRFFSEKGPWCFLVDEAHNLPDRARDAYGFSLSPQDLLLLSEHFAEGEVKALFRLAAKGIGLSVDRAVKNELTPDKDGIPCGFASSRELPGELPSVLRELCDRAFEVASDRENIDAASRRQARKAGYELQSMCEKLSHYGSGYITFFERRGVCRTLRVICLDPTSVLSSRLSLGTAAVLFSATLHPTEYYKNVCGGRKADPTVELGTPFEESHVCISVMDKLPVGYSTRTDTLHDVMRAVLTTVKAKPGNYMVFCPSYAYLEALEKAIRRAVPGLDLAVQKRQMSQSERAAFLARFDAMSRCALVGLCVMGGIYGEGVNLVGRRLIGAVIIGVGLPSLSDEREAMREYYDEKNECGTAYAYTYPGLNRVLQAAGRVIRNENDRGVIVLIDERFARQDYRELIPDYWHGLKYAGDTVALSAQLSRFWQSIR